MRKFKQSDQKCFCECESLGFFSEAACLLSQLSTTHIATPLTLHFSNKQTQKHTQIHCHLYKEIGSKLNIN